MTELSLSKKFLFCIWASACLISDFTFGLPEPLTPQQTAVRDEAAQQQQQPEEFTPLVAFHCGYRNRYYSKEAQGSWITDDDPRATCLTGKLDILKYCKKVYPELHISNIVEASREYELPSWCKEDGHSCKYTFNTKPYKCVAGKFESEALLVPEHCHFGHVDDAKTCREFDYWNRTATQECAKQSTAHILDSFAMLEPCGLDMFSGVEYVCCPTKTQTKEGRSAMGEEPVIDLKVKVKVVDDSQSITSTKSPIKSTTTDSEDESTEEDDDDSSDEDEEDGQQTDNRASSKEGNNDKKKNGGAQSKKRVLKTTTVGSTKVKEVQTEGGMANEDDEDDDDEDENESNASTDDPYFRSADPDREYAVYRSAIDRLERKHRQKVADAVKKLSDSEVQYRDNKEHDEARVQAMKEEFKLRMRQLEKEHHAERHQVERVHEQRVSAALNERKRQAIKSFRRALNAVVGGDQKRQDLQAGRVSKALQDYVRAEEKDRTHALNRYRFLLKADSDEAKSMRDGLIKRLHDIDLRINGTIEMLRDGAIGLQDKIKPSILDYWQTFRDENTPGKVDDSLTWIGDAMNGQHLIEFYTKQRDYEYKMEKEQSQHHHEHPELHEIDLSNKPESDIRQSPLDDEKKEQKMIASFQEHKDEFAQHAHAFSLKESFQHAQAFDEETLPPHDGRRYGVVILGVAGVTLLVAALMAVVMLRRRCSLHSQGFVAVDAMTPEERHVAGMQFTGYENPTYKHFDAKVA